MDNNYWKPSFKYFVDMFCSMARMTTPHGNEAYVWAQLPNAPFGAPPNVHPNYDTAVTYVDGDNNYIVVVGGEHQKTLWLCHCDTADSDPTHVNLLKHTTRAGDLIISTDGMTILGADDKIGCAIMACMIRCGVPGIYAFCSGEEVGCVGSSKLAKSCTASGKTFDHVVSFDRKGTSSVITHQLGRRTASDAWAQEMCDQLSMRGLLSKPDATGVFTDSNEFKDIGRECTNLSVGYDGQHTTKEEANMSYAYELLCAMIDLGHVGLPAPQRDPADKDMSDEDMETLWDSFPNASGSKWRDRSQWWSADDYQNDSRDFFTGEAQ